MEHKLSITEDLLWDYADGFLPDDEKRQLENHLLLHPEWQERLDAILDTRQTLRNVPLASPDAGFADRVLAAWAVEQTKQHAQAKGKDWIIRLIAIVFCLFVLTPVFVMVFAALQLPPGQPSILNLPEMNLPEMPSINWSYWIGNPFLLNGLLFTLAFMGLLFLDKYLQHRRLAQQLGY